MATGSRRIGSRRSPTLHSGPPRASAGLPPAAVFAHPVSCQLSCWCREGEVAGATHRVREAYLEEDGVVA